MEGRSLSRDKSQEDITLLGKKNVKYHYDYCPEILETFENRHPDNDYWVKFNCPEFTALCPITGQPDYATIYISYIPGRRMVESKSLKLYLVSFRNPRRFPRGRRQCHHEGPHPPHGSEVHRGLGQVPAARRHLD